MSKCEEALNLGNVCNWPIDYYAELICHSELIHSWGLPSDLFFKSLIL